MIAIPFKWFPYLCVLCGAYGLLFGDEEIITSILLLAFGAVWLYFKHRSRAASSPKNAESVPVRSAPVGVTNELCSAEESTVLTAGNETVCPCCRAIREDAENLYCSVCGYKY